MGEFNSKSEEKDKVKNENDKKFNLLDKEWINVVTNYKGTTKRVGMREFFEHAHEYIALAGDTPTQDFAVMRFLLAVLHTVFSRYDADGNVYDGIKLDKRRKQINEISGRAAKNYPKALMKTWKDLWNMGKFPNIVNDYLEEWRDRFYLFDDKYPFYQVTEDIMKKVNEEFSNVNSKKSMIPLKLMNRTISESMNKEAIFSPRNKESKNILTKPELVRWLITYQGVSNASDKTKIDKENGKSIGWIYKLGGVYLSTDNIFKTMLLNLMLNHTDTQYNNIQKPCWEYEQDEIYNKYLNNDMIDNLAELYTNWSRIMYYFKYTGNDYKYRELKDKYVFRIVKTSPIDEKDYFLEPMTIWKENKGKMIPKKHEQSKSVWRSFGLIINNKNRLPGVIDNLTSIKEVVSDVKDTHIKCISAVDDDNSSSRAMIDEVYDSIDLNLEVATDLKENGWVERINEIVEETKSFIDEKYKKFIKVYVDLEGVDDKNKQKRIDRYLETLYYKIDKPFRDWLSSLKINDNKEEKLQKWLDTLKNITLDEANALSKNLSNKFYIGIKYNINNKCYYKNIATALNDLMININKLQRRQ